MTLAREAAHGEIGQLAIGYNAPAGFRIFPRVVPPYRLAGSQGAAHVSQH